MTNEPGLNDAVKALETVRKKLRAKDVTAHWPTEFGDVAVVVDEDGCQFFVDGEAVPMKDAA